MSSNKQETSSTVGPFTVINKQSRVSDEQENGFYYSAEVLRDGKVVLKLSGHDICTVYGDMEEGNCDVEVLQGADGAYFVMARDIKKGKKVRFELK